MWRWQPETLRRLLLLCLILIMAGALTGFVYLTKAHYDEGKQFTNSFRQTHEKLSSVLFVLQDQIHSVYMQMSLDDPLFEWLQQTESGVHNMYMLREIQQQFLKTINSNPLIVSIYLYNKSNDTVLSTNYEFTRLEQFPDKALFDGKPEGSGRWVQARLEKASYGNAKTIITFVGNLRGVGWVAINVDEQKLFADFPESHHMLLVSRDGQVITYRSGLPVPMDSQKLNQIMQEGMDAEAPHPVDNVLAMVSDQSPGEWKTISYVPRIELTPEYRHRQQMILLLMSVILASGIGLYVFMRKSYFQKIVQYENRYHRNLEDLRTHFVLNLLTGKLKEQDMAGPIREMNLKLASSKYMVVVIQIDDYYRYLLNMEKDERFFMDKTIYHAFQWMFKTRYAAYPVKAEPDKMAILISLPEHAEEDSFISSVEGTVRYLQKEIRDTCNLTVCAGVSQVVPSIATVHDGYFQALQAIEYKVIYGRDAVIHSKSIPHKQQQDGLFPTFDINELIACMKEGDMVKFEANLDSMIKTMTTEGRFSLELLNAALSNLLFGIVKLALELRQDISGMVQENMFMKLYSYEFIEDKKTYIVYIAKTVSDHVHVRKTGQNKTFQMIKEYIEDNFDKAISLTVVSDSLGINPSYISSLIKNELGYGFVDYLNHLRIKKALLLLENKHKPIKQISEECGYDTVHSFIRNFKKIHFFTPSEYRSKLQQK
ncbi:helix-turn-helix domain-containing protein [Paenibacillus sp. NPDC056579]|uniref:helix-turn-helix domain-containing protein n=1 Tax=Paenibacillus sp. NPDC056579 TaxID=3345871 RepID=UPI0036BBB72F